MEALQSAHCSFSGLDTIALSCCGLLTKRSACTIQPVTQECYTPSEVCSNCASTSARDEGSSLLTNRSDCRPLSTTYCTGTSTCINLYWLVGMRGNVNE